MVCVHLPIEIDPPAEEIVDEEAAQVLDEADSPAEASA